MSTYEGSLYSIHDNDTFLMDSTAWSTASVVSDVFDLAAATTFMNHVPILMIELDEDFSLASALAASQTEWQALVVQDSSDNSTFWDRFAIPLRYCSASTKNIGGTSTCDASEWNKYAQIGLVNMRRYIRLALNLGTGGTTTVSVKAWLRAGLSK